MNMVYVSFFLYSRKAIVKWCFYLFFSLIAQRIKFTQVRSPFVFLEDTGKMEMEMERFVCVISLLILFMFLVLETTRETFDGAPNDHCRRLLRFVFWH